MNRDPKTGRFLPGNQAAKGNRGNTFPKWGNANAMKHGLFCRYPIFRIIDGFLYIVTANRCNTLCIPPGYFTEKENEVLIHEDLIEELKKKGVQVH
ncbi:hypothetical protein [Luteimonas abyssi]|uniref:hypothetical protein n=1 Tax=Luteimonas abyssi TaxID=1247514 RepID=UPI0012F7391E|nr:hypothetical protein [Luteimonas abyssi]